MTIQRFHFEAERGIHGARISPVKSDDGKYVTYEDHQRIVDDLERQLRESQNARMEAIARQWGKEKY